MTVEEPKENASQGKLDARCGNKDHRILPSQLLALSKVALFILLSGMICQATGGLGSWGGLGNVPSTSHCFLLKSFRSMERAASGVLLERT